MPDQPPCGLTWPWTQKASGAGPKFDASMVSAAVALDSLRGHNTSGQWGYDAVFLFAMAFVAEQRSMPIDDDCVFRDAMHLCKDPEFLAMVTATENIHVRRPVDAPLGSRENPIVVDSDDDSDSVVDLTRSDDEDWLPPVKRARRV